MRRSHASAAERLSTKTGGMTTGGMTTGGMVGIPNTEDLPDILGSCSPMSTTHGVVYSLCPNNFIPVSVVAFMLSHFQGTRPPVSLGPFLPDS